MVLSNVGKGFAITLGVLAAVFVVALLTGLLGR